MSLPPLPIGAPIALNALRDAAIELSEPTKPGKVFACLKAELPLADKYRHCIAILSDTRKLAISTLNGSSWEWTDSNGSAL